MEEGTQTQMNGSECLVRTLVAGGVNVCFANPGTSEMHFVAALDRVEGMRCVLALTKAWRRVRRMVTRAWQEAGRHPAHLGPGLANGLSNLHNAMKARRRWSTSLVTTHLAPCYDAPLTSDIEGLRGRSRSGSARRPTRNPLLPMGPQPSSPPAHRQLGSRRSSCQVTQLGKGKRNCAGSADSGTPPRRCQSH